MPGGIYSSHITSPAHCNPPTTSLDQLSYLNINSTWQAQQRRHITRHNITSKVTPFASSFRESVSESDVTLQSRMAPASCGIPNHCSGNSTQIHTSKYCWEGKRCILPRRSHEHCPPSGMKVLPCNVPKLLFDTGANASYLEYQTTQPPCSLSSSGTIAGFPRCRKSLGQPKSECKTWWISPA